MAKETTLVWENLEHVTLKHVRGNEIWLVATLPKTATSQALSYSIKSAVAVQSLMGETENPDVYLIAKLPEFSE